MPLAVCSSKNSPTSKTLNALPVKGLFSHLLDTDHDAWSVNKEKHTWSFYREIGGSGSSLPEGSVVITAEQGKQSITFYHARWKRSLIETYREELPRAVELLVSRERSIDLFTNLARTLNHTQWDFRLGFYGTRVTERCAQLRNGTDAYSRIVGTKETRTALFSPTGTKFQRQWSTLGILVSQHEQESPLLQCAINYPRPLQLSFHSSRLIPGLHAITDHTAQVVVEHNRNLEKSF